MLVKSLKTSTFQMNKALDVVLQLPHKFAKNANIYHPQHLYFFLNVCACVGVGEQVLGVESALNYSSKLTTIASPQLTDSREPGQTFAAAFWQHRFPVCGGSLQISCTQRQGGSANICSWESGQWALASGLPHVTNGDEWEEGEGGGRERVYEDFFFFLKRIKKN